MAMTRSDMERLLGPVDNQLAADIARTNATPEELARAMAWLNAEDALVNDGQHLPTGRVAELITILAPPEDEDSPGKIDASDPFI